MKEVTNSSLAGINQAIQQLRQVGAHIYDSEAFEYRLTVDFPNGEHIDGLRYLDLPALAEELANENHNHHRDLRRQT